MNFIELRKWNSQIKYLNNKEIISYYLFIIIILEKYAFDSITEYTKFIKEYFQAEAECVSSFH